jgi:hypothetical protein
VLVLGADAVAAQGDSSSGTVVARASSSAPSAREREPARARGPEPDGSSRVGARIALGEVATDTGVTVTLDEVRPFGWSRTVEQLRQVLDRARIDHNLKRTAYDLVLAAEGPTDAAARLRGLELEHDVEAALLELALARY